ncbi:hypothetical protein PVAP13_2KG189891 [Panicum virgatum]|uniref:Uncharacterized protein n=1 Tax=Panicum virgatum TaxID=38727 RepID=A0A8T0W552_PANVG|nr:hypothetical protein PVAP13_2KG189891 [Panicum virgatum]
MTSPPATSAETARRSKRLLRPLPETTPTLPPPEKHRRKDTEADNSHAIADKRASREYLQLYSSTRQNAGLPYPLRRPPPAEGRRRGGSRQIGGEKALACFSPSHSCSNKKGGEAATTGAFKNAKMQLTEHCRKSLLIRTHRCKFSYQQMVREEDGFV